MKLYVSSILMAALIAAIGCSNNDPKLGYKADKDAISRDVGVVKLNRGENDELAQREALEPCLDLAEKLTGTWAEWRFTNLLWTLKGSKTKYTSDEMANKGYNIIIEVFPTDVRAELDRETAKLNVEMTMALNNQLNPVRNKMSWTISARRRGCVLHQNANQKNTLLNGSMTINLDPDARMTSHFTAEYKFSDKSGEYRGTGEVRFTRR